MERLISEIFPKYKRWIPDVNDDELEKCEGALRALRKLADPKAIDPLISLLRKHPYPSNLPDCAARALSAIEEPSTVPILIEVFHEKAPPGFEGYEHCRRDKIAYAVATIAAKTRDPQCLSCLIDFWQGIAASNASDRDKVERAIQDALKDVTGIRSFDKYAWLKWLKSPITEEKT